MDVQGSQYHLLDGRSDWSRCVDPSAGLTLGELWADAADGLPTVPTGWEYDETGHVLRLRRDGADVIALQEIGSANRRERLRPGAAAVHSGG